MNGRDRNPTSQPGFMSSPGPNAFREWISKEINGFIEAAEKGKG
jgi:hypothetical protein